MASLREQLEHLDKKELVELVHSLYQERLFLEIFITRVADISKRVAERKSAGLWEKMGMELPEEEMDQLIHDCSVRAGKYLSVEQDKSTFEQIKKIEETLTRLESKVTQIAKQE